jgi:hypothetical protein
VPEDHVVEIARTSRIEVLRFLREKVGAADIAVDEAVAILDAVAAAVCEDRFVRPREVLVNADARRAVRVVDWRLCECVAHDS